jgi:heat shock protein HslJ
MKKLLLTSVFTLMILTACVGGGSPASVEGAWQLVSYGPASSQVPALPDVETSIEFKDGQMSGNVGCNGFGGDYELDGDTIKFGPVMSTMMFCEEIADQESGTLAVFQESATISLNEDLLTITSADGNMSIVLEQK